MNNRIEELILAYLHRGSTPEQEKELFEACKADPEAAKLLRQHVILSLKLRQLREGADVPAETRNNLLLRINEEEARLAVERPSKTAAARIPERRFGWAHLFGGALATAVVTAAAFFFFYPAADPAVETAAIPAAIHDTVLVARTDTLVRVVRVARVVSRPEDVSIAAERKNAVTPRGIALPEATPADIAAQIPEGQNRSDDTRRQEPGALQETAVVPAQNPDSEARSTAIAEGSLRDGVSYLEQYNAMLVSLEKVRINAGDRIRN